MSGRATPRTPEGGQTAAPAAGTAAREPGADHPVHRLHHAAGNRAVHDLLGGDPGQPLAPRTRALVEARLGHDFAGVRVHTGRRADEAARALNATAFTVGDRVAFRRGAFAPDSPEGLRLLAHELAHVLQQRQGPLRIQRNGGDDAEEERGVVHLFTVTVAREMSASELLLEVLQQYHGVDEEGARALIAERGWHWTGEGESVTAEDVANGYKLVRVRDRSVRRASAEETREARRAYGGIPADDRRAITQETNRQFWDRTRYRPGEELGDSPDDRRMREYWMQIRDELVRQRVRLDGLPVQIRDMMFGETGRRLEPSEYAQALRIADKLMELSEEERRAYLARTTARTSDLSVYEASIDRYREEMRERRDASEQRERAKTRLFGLEEVYRQYRSYMSLLSSTSTLGAFAAAGNPRAAGAGLGAQPTLSREREALTAALQEHGFASISDFEAAIRAFEGAFQAEAVFIAREMLGRYEHVLWTQQERYADPAETAALHTALAPARAEFQEAHRIRDEHAMMPMTPEEMADQAYWSGQFQERMTAGRAAVTGVAGAHPIADDPALDPEALALAGASAVGGVALSHIRERREDVDETRTNLGEQPSLVWDLDLLVAQAMREQDVRDGSIYHLIIQDHLRDTGIERAIIALAIGVIALAAGLVSAGTGTVAVLGASAALGLGAYMAWEEFRQYEVRSAAHGAALLTDDPSFAWVVVAVIGAGLDLAGAAAAIRAMSTSVRAFNATDDIVELERSLERLSDVDDALRQNVIRAARRELEAREAWKAARADYYGRALAVIDPLVTPMLNLAVHFTYPVYLSLRRGIISIERFLLTREAVSLIGDFRALSPRQMARVRAAYQLAWDQAQQVAAHGHSVGMLDTEIEQFLRMWNHHPDVSADDMMRQMSQWAEPLTARAGARARVAPDMVLDPQSRALLPDFEHQVAGTGGIQSIRARPAGAGEGRLSVTIEGEILPGRLTRRADAVTPTRRRAPDFNRSSQLFSAEEAFPALTAAQRARWQRLHLWGPGFGDEAAAGMMWGPRNVNLRWQNDSIETYIRDLAELSQRSGGRTRVRATAVSWENPTPSGFSAPQGEHFLKHAEYEVTLLRPGEPDQTIRISLDVAEPPAGGARATLDPPGAANLGDLF